MEKTFGTFLQELCNELMSNHGWREHANALLYTQGAPKLMDYILMLWQEGQTVELSADLVEDRLNYPR